MISIKDLNKAEVLKSLYNRSHCQGMGWLQAVPDGYVTVEHCEELLKQQTYFDYLYGKVLKVDLSGDEFDERLYDRDCGAGEARRAIELVRYHKKERKTEGVFFMMTDRNFQVSIDPIRSEVAFRVRGRKSLEALIFTANKLLDELDDPEPDVTPILFY